MIRTRFKLPVDDYRPVVWPIKHPYWCSGQSLDPDNHYFWIVAYADDEQEIMENWPEAEELDSEEVEEYEFTTRFTKPDWWTNEPR